VIRLLKRAGKPMTAKEVGMGLGIRSGCASRKLNQLAKYHFIRKIPVRIRIRTQDHHQYKYGLKKR